MEKKIERVYGRGDLAELLVSMADALRVGKMSLNDREHPIPEELLLKTHLKLKKGLFHYRFELLWPSSVSDSEASPESARLPHDDFSVMKKELAVSFKQMKRAVTQGGISSQNGAFKEFVSKSRTFLGLCEPEWQEAANEYGDHLENLIRSVEQGQEEFILHEISDLENRMVACHRKFR